MSRVPSRKSERAARRQESVSARTASHELELCQLVVGCQRGHPVSPASASRIAELVPKLQAEKVAAVAIEAREQMNLAQVSLLMVREMCRHKTHRALVAETLVRVAQQPEDLIEFVAMYWKDGRVPLSTQAKKGLATVFPKFDEKQLATCKSKSGIKLRDVLFLSHAKPRDDAQAAVWKRLIWGRLRKRPMASS
jgi:60 kDa SS-A/Ro ribonucleoprotein